MPGATARSPPSWMPSLLTASYVTLVQSIVSICGDIFFCTSVLKGLATFFALSVPCINTNTLYFILRGKKNSML